MLFKSDRQFRIWDYNVSHNQMLIRSPRSKTIQTNLDLVFWGIDFIQMPSILTGIEILGTLTADEEAVARLSGKQCKASEVRVISSTGKRFYVVAAGYKVLENTLDIFESSLEYFSATSGARDLGAVIERSGAEMGNTDGNGDADGNGDVSSLQLR